MNKERCFARAEQLFLKVSGVGQEGEKFERMRRQAYAIRQEIEPRVDVQAAYCCYGEFSLDGEVLTVGGRNLTCKAFAQLSPDSLEEVCVYAVTAGDYSLEERPIMDRLYADIWGTAFTDAMREMLMDQLRECFSKQGGFGISDSFGPGFYGMDTAEMQKLPSLVDFQNLGMEVRESGIILPLKSCAGLVFKVNGRYEALNSACEHCLGSVRTCSLCSMVGN